MRLFLPTIPAPTPACRQPRPFYLRSNSSKQERAGSGRERSSAKERQISRFAATKWQSKLPACR